MDFRIEASSSIYVSKAVLVILAIELFIRLNFHLLDYMQVRVFAYAICLTPSFGFILSRPILRLNSIEVEMAKDKIIIINI